MNFKLIVPMQLEGLLRSIIGQLGHSLLLEIFTRLSPIPSICDIFFLSPFHTQLDDMVSIGGKSDWETNMVAFIIVLYHIVQQYGTIP